MKVSIFPSTHPLDKPTLPLFTSEYQEKIQQALADVLQVSREEIEICMEEAGGKTTMLRLETWFPLEREKELKAALYFLFRDMDFGGGGIKFREKANQKERQFYEGKRSSRAVHDHDDD